MSKYTLFIKGRFLIVVLFIGMFLSSCAKFHPAKEKRKYSSEYCYPEIHSPKDTTFTPLEDISESVLEDTVLLDYYTKHDLVLGNALGILPRLQGLVLLKQVFLIQPTIENQIKILEARQSITQELLLASVTVSSVAAELDCEGERADQFASYLDDKDRNINTKLTTTSILLGAVAGIVTTSLSPGKAYYAIGIGAGVGSAALALATLFPKKKMVFSHPRNLLADIWYQPKKSTLYPPFVWYILNDKFFSNSKEHSICYNLRERWMTLGQLDQDNEKKGRRKIHLFFEEGGAYRASELHSRADMINHVQSAIRLINQNLESLILSVSR